jgi:hypothetical protein
MPTAEGAELSGAVNAEFEDFHGFINEWFRGECPEDEELFERRHASHLAEGFQIILPDGSVLDRDGLISLIRGLYGKNPSFKKQFRNIQLRPMNCKGYSLVNYEEWQKGAVNFEPPNHARRVSAVLRVATGDPVQLEWLQIHETKMPEQATAGDPFDF